MKAARLLCSSLAFFLACSLAACRPEEPKKIVLQPCQPGGVSAECGTLAVYENRETNQGRKIDIHVAVIRARSANPQPDPVFYLAGGPGSSAIEDAEYAMLMLKTANKDRDIVLVEQRGTGQTNPLVCPQPAAAGIGIPLVDAPAIEDLRQCIAKLDGDPAAYTTAWAMDDLDDVRAALGYDQVNLYGESYGPTAEQVYLQRHEAHVRTMTLEGVTLIDVPMFERVPRGSQQALDFLYTRCQSDAACHAAYPNLAAEVAEVIARLEKQPVDLPLIDPETGNPVTLTRDMLVMGMHSMLAATENAVLLPYLMHQAYLGNWAAIAQAYAPGGAGEAAPAMWKMMNLTILCHEDWARTRRDETTKMSAGSYLGYEDVRRITVPEEICAAVPKPRPAALYKPLETSPAPVLIISNQVDPQNPPENVAGAKEHYPNSLTLVAPGQGHGYTGYDCRDQIIASFIERGSTEGLNVDCLAQEPLPSFVIVE